MNNSCSKKPWLWLKSWRKWLWYFVIDVIRRILDNSSTFFLLWRWNMWEDQLSWCRLIAGLEQIVPLDNLSFTMQRSYLHLGVISHCHVRGNFFECLKSIHYNLYFSNNGILLLFSSWFLYEISFLSC